MEPLVRDRGAGRPEIRAPLAAIAASCGVCAATETCG